MNVLAGFSPVALGLIVAAAVGLVALFLQAASSVVAPLLLAVFIVIVTLPPLRWMKSKGVPKYLAIAIIAFILFDLGSLLALIYTGTLDSFRDNLPSYQERLAHLSEQLGVWLERLGMENSDEAAPALLEPSRVGALARGALSSVSSLFMTGLFILFVVIFMLAEAPGLPAKLKAAFAPTDDGLARIQSVIGSVRKYMLIKILTSFATAVCVYVLLLLLGIDFAPLWAILAFFLNFIPFLGNILMMVPAVLTALVQKDVTTALMVAGGFIVINTAIPNALEPRLIGKGFGISPVTVFISLMFWGWILGPVGYFLSTPLSIAAITAMQAHPSTRPLAVMLGPPIEEEAQADGEAEAPPGESPPIEGLADEE